MSMQLLGHHHVILFVLLSWCSIVTETKPWPASSSVLAPPIAKLNCTTHCGINVSIPYPFGVGPNKDCYFNEWFQIDCNESTGHKPFLRRVQMEVLNISIDGTLQVKSPVTFFGGCKGKETHQAPNLTGSPFVYLDRKNMFTAVSCGRLATMRSDENVVQGCNSTCDDQSTDSAAYRCGTSGTNCCQTTIPPNISVFTAEIQPRDQIDGCNYAFLVDQDWFLKNLSSYRAIQGMDSVPVVLEWNISLDNTSHKAFEGFIGRKVRQYDGNNFNNDSTPYCEIYNATTSTYNQSSVHCFCPGGFQGNPYLLHPCQDIDECKLNRCMDPGMLSSLNFSGSPMCKNFVGGFTCYSNVTVLGVPTCEYYGEYYSRCYYKPKPPRPSRAYRIRAVLLGVFMGPGLLLLLVGAWYAYKVIKKRKNIQRKEKFFKRNGGLLLQQQLSSGEINVEKIKLFKSEELEKSTDKFNIDRILGQGGQGTVYKGMFADGRVVAIKKSKIIDEGQLSEFINEVVILSQINHRNVVQLLGCCLETEVPLLVYEFIPNGTLSHYIHERNEDFPLTWKMRLRIATEIAGALSYLHGAASCPIYHRDIKSTNILLDEKYTGKVADFGTSRSIVIGQTHLTTVVQGTFGYLDPEYFQSSQFTEKSDVYSFGVVLVELLTGLQPVFAVIGRSRNRSLATYFNISMQEDRLFDILDARVLMEGSETEIKLIANLAKRCLSLNGRNRPTMREVAAELEALEISEKTEYSPQKFERSEFSKKDSIEHWDVIIGPTGTWSASDDGPTSSLL
ncbi:PREDICTED: wall-associated receptor kinase-like 6 [Prunus mume]|uniref:Wall-associated receptor kinase-like 6 n=1 Tax=Prunus mume TaxID=102107 RepID=A0ABM1LNJ7_PRUMU|nr:PREDICTED: wall-associated receptor kinase-like 6 [Prunus mume]